MPAPASEGSGAGAQGVSAPLKWLCDHIALSLGGGEEAHKRLLSSDCRCCLHLEDNNMCCAMLRGVQ